MKRSWGTLSVATALAIGSLGTWAVRAGGDDRGADANKLLIMDKSGSGKAKVSWVAKHANVHKGADGDGSQLDGTFEIIYADSPANRATFALPSPWSSNNAGKAKYYNLTAPNGPSQVKIARVKNFKAGKLSARGLGGIDISSAPGSGGIITVLTIDNAADGETHRVCTLFSAAGGSTIAHKPIPGGYKLLAKFGKQTTCPSLAPTCSDGMQNGTESDVDCGGGVCNPCNDGGGCAVGTDCDSGVCSMSTCQTPSCSDGVENGLETDTDCGGPNCPDCPPGSGCQAGTDCTTGLCTGNVCQPPPAGCTDNMLNGMETDIDCGGPDCPACPPGSDCQSGGDCDSGVCTGSVCQAPSCLDGVQNGSESDTDCGGSCPDCAPGSSCSTGGDCDSGVCTGNICQNPSCSDGVENGTETDTDCGGGCAACPPGSGCLSGGDCDSGVCSGSVCQSPSCSDGVQNGGETDIDCGGATACPRCAAGFLCGAGSDCSSTICSGGICRCGNQSFTFTVNSNTGGAFDSAEWPGGTQTQSSSPGCSVTINNPNANIDLVCSLAAPFSVSTTAGFSSCFGSGGEDGDGCQPLSCPPAGVGSCCNARPSCSAALNGSGSARYLVSCLE